MEENSNQDKKKMIITLVVGIVTLLILVIGATYAYFYVEINNSINNTNITTSIGKLDTIALKTNFSNFNLNLTNDNMSLNSLQNYFANDNNDLVTSLEEGIHKIATLSAYGGDGNTNYKCHGTVTLNMDISNGSMGSVLEKSDIIAYINFGSNIKIIDLNELKTTGIKTYDFAIDIKSNSERDMLFYVMLENKDTSQNYLSEKSMTLNISTKLNDCNFSESKIENTLRKNDANATLSKDITGGMYRYQGTKSEVNSNYICFGTTNKDECIEKSDKYMYRIIGINENENMKLIKNTSIGNYYWNENGKDFEWPDNELYMGLNDNYFFNNSEYINNDWKNKIVNYDWFYGDINSSSMRETVNDIYKVETGQKNSQHNIVTNSGSTELVDCFWNKEIYSPIGLIYVSDYFYATSKDNINCRQNSEKCLEGWIFNGEEWTMSRYGKSGGSAWYAWKIDFDGDIAYSFDQNGNLKHENSVRPVFYLTNDIELSGTGTTIDPYIINFN